MTLQNFVYTLNHKKMNVRG